MYVYAPWDHECVRLADFSRLTSGFTSVPLTNGAHDAILYLPLRATQSPIDVICRRSLNFVEQRYLGIIILLLVVASPITASKNAT